MGLDPVRNFARAILASGIDEVATTVTLSSGQGSLFPQPATEGPFNIVIYAFSLYTYPAQDSDVEIVRCIARTGDVLTVTRAQEGTVAVAHNAAFVYYAAMLAITQKTTDDLRLSLPTTYRSIGTYGGNNGCLYVVGCSNANQGIPSSGWVQGVLYAVPTIEIAGCTIDRVGIRKNTTNPLHAKCAIYYDNGSFYPGMLLADLGAASVGGSYNGLGYFTASPLPLTFPTTGIYWYVMKPDGTYGISNIVTDSSILGYFDDNTLNNTNNSVAAAKATGYSSGSVYANAMPSVFGAGASLLTGWAPCYYRRYSVA